MAEPEHPNESVAITVYTPAAKLLIVVELPNPPFHCIVKGPLPPVAVTVALPFSEPKQVALLNELILTVGPLVLVILIVVSILQALASVTVIV